MSPSQVAQATGASRRTVMRAVEAGELEAFRDNRNHWKITVQAVEEWAIAQCAPSVQSADIAQSAHALAHVEPSIANSLEELRDERTARRLAEIEAAELRGKLVVTEAERDRLYRIIQSLTAAQKKRRAWWPF